MSAYHENALQSGSNLAEYTIESVLGYGGFSITYLAQDTALGAKVAIKEYLPQEIAAREDQTAFVVPKPSKDAIRHYHWGLKNFVKEARALARFKHANIVRVLRFIEANGTAYTVMEYEQGQTLAQYLKVSGGRLDESNLLRIVMPILNGLHAVHEVGLLHLDIKPENIYLRQDGSPMLIDFGSARHSMTESRPTGRVTLTHGYAPVEQYPDKGKLGPWSDVYALGATMYRCVTGKRPEDSLERYRALLDYKTDPLRPASKAATGRYRDVVLECIEHAMQIYAKDRPQTAREFQDDLLGKSRNPRSSAMQAPAIFAQSAKPATTSRSRKSATQEKIQRDIAQIRSAIGIIALAVVIITGWLLWSEIFGFWRGVLAPTPESVNLPVRGPAPRGPVRDSVSNSGAPKPTVQTSSEVPPPSTLRSVLTGHSDWVQAVAFLPGSRKLVTASNDRTVRFWNIDSGALANTIKLRFPVNAIDSSPDGNSLAIVGTDGAVQLWDTRTMTSTGRYEGAGYPFFTVAYAPDGRFFAAAGKDRTIYLWNTANGSRRTLEGHTGEISALVFRPNSKSIVSAGADRSIRIWDVESGQEQTSLPGHKEAVLALAFSPDGRWLASSDAAHTVRIWDMRNQTLLHTINDVNQNVLALTFAPSGSWLAAGAADSGVHIFDTETGRLVQTLRGHGGYVQTLAVSSDGLLASGSRDNSVRLWQAGPGG